MAEDWMPGATRLDVGDHAPCDGGEPKAIGHITWDVNATPARPVDLVPYERLQDWFGRNPAGKPSAPTILWDPFTGRFTQFYPAWSRSKSLVDLAGGTRTNRAGRVVIQVEALFFPYCRVNGVVYARLVDTPCKGWAELNAYVRSHGVVDDWPMGRPVDFASHRSEQVWENAGGWYGHSQVPENDHQDPGSWPAFITEHQEEEDMTPEQAKQLAQVTGQVAELKKFLVPYMGWQYKGAGTVDAWALLTSADRNSAAAAKSTNGLATQIDRLQVRDLTDAQIIRIANEVAASPSLANAIADLVVAKLSKRMEA